MKRFLTATGLAASVILVSRWLLKLRRRLPEGAMYPETQKARRLHLTHGAAMASMLARMRRVPSYRPNGFLPGAAGLRHAESVAATAREARRDLQSEGDA